MAVHTIRHIEISAKDVKAAGAFYNRLFGWEIHEFPEMEYTSFMIQEGMGGGFMPLTDKSPAGLTVPYVDTDSIEASLAKAVALGAEVETPRTEIPGMGWYAVFCDPTGNRIGLFETLPQANEAVEP